MELSIPSSVDPRQLGDYVRRSRLREGWSIRRLAAAVGVDATWLSRLERGGYTSPDPRRLRRLSEVLNLAATDLFAMVGYRGAEGLPAFGPYLRAKYDLPPEAIEQLLAHFSLVNDRFGRRNGTSDARSDRDPA